MTKKIIITSGLALFAMFFGAGNIIYPLELGAHAGSHIAFVLVAFLISGIGLPFMGLFATSLYNGDYWAFFRRLGQVPAFLLITFLILTIGPFIATPRTETVAYHTLQSFLPTGLNNPYVFSGLYCLAIFCFTYRNTTIIDIIGRFLSPIKLTLFAILIVAGLLSAHAIQPNTNFVSTSITMGLVDGYSTMDLLATFFFCSIVYRNILLKAKCAGITDQKTIVRIFLYSCIVGASILACVYVGFMLLALCHADQLQNVETAQMIVAISNIVLGKFGALFVGICVSFACLVTAIALTEVTTSFVYEHVLLKKVPRLACLLTTIGIIFAVSNLGFAGIMNVALPILEILYPALIFYCIINISFKLFSTRNQFRASANDAEIVHESSF
jgi:LIVCS family branched-chain amino acid:cation transporter